MSLKSRLKKTRILYRGVSEYLRWSQDRKIRRELKEYEERARINGIPLREESADIVFRRVRDRLAKRDIFWPPMTQGRRLHILYVSPSVPGDWERINIPPQLKNLGDASFFFLKEQEIPSYDTIVNYSDWLEVRKRVDAELPGFVRRLDESKPVDLMLSYLSGSQIYPRTIREIGEMGIPTFSFHWDDKLFFRGRMIGDQWSGPCAVCKDYDLNLSNSLSTLVKYRVEGAEVIFWPEGANPDHFKPLDITYKYDVSFVGARYGVRPILVDYLKRNGICVECFGPGWKYGSLTPHEMIKVYAQSRINLGFGYVGFSSEQCLKGRDFEVPSCGAVYLTSHNEDLARVYKIGEEIETYLDFDDCVRKIRALLADPEQCERMRLSARKAVLERHTWVKRIYQLLDGSGCPFPEER